MNFEESKPLLTRALIAAHGPGIQIMSKLAFLASLINISPGSLHPFAAASLTRAIDFPSVNFVIK